jgi:dTDP-4-dehydrorhamnose reductase
MKYLVTGAEGQLGLEWVNFLEMRKIPFHGYGRTSLDITDYDLVRNTLDTLRPGVIINCAAYTDVDGSEKNAETAWKVNREAVEFLARWCYENNSKMVHYSTDYVFPGRREDEDRFPEGYTEKSRIDPVNSYGRSKAEGEKCLLESGTDHLLVRVSWLSGRYGRNFVKTILKSGKERNQLRVVDDQKGSPTFTISAVEYTSMLIEGSFSGTYHISSNGLISWYDYAVEILRLAGIDTEVVPVTSEEFQTLAKRPAFSKLDNRKLCRNLGIEMDDWKAGLQKLINNLT